MKLPFRFGLQPKPHKVVRALGKLTLDRLPSLLELHGGPSNSPRDSPWDRH